MKIKKYILAPALTLVLSPGLTSCLNDDDDSSFDVEAWKFKNETYLTQVEDSVDAVGNKLYKKIEPIWAPGAYVLAKWHNDTTLTAANLKPMDNSTVDVDYQVYYVDGTMLDTSTTKPLGFYRCRPSDNIVGFWSMLTNMHEGDSVTCVIPTTSAYGTVSSSVIPYSTLIYHMKLRSIYKYELPN